MQGDVVSKLITLAAEMIGGKGMPSPYVEDWNLPPSTTMKVRRAIGQGSWKANEQCRLWGIAVREIAEEVRKHGF